MLRWTLASLHLLALGIGLGAVWARGRALNGPLDRAGLRRVFTADTWWGVAAALWLVTGLWRLLAGTEKATGYYLHNHLFWTKMMLFVLILLLELAPMLGLIAWRRQLARGVEPDTRRARLYRRLSVSESIIVILMLVIAAGMARGYGAT